MEKFNKILYPKIEIVKRDDREDQKLMAKENKFRPFLDARITRLNLHMIDAVDQTEIRLKPSGKDMEKVGQYYCR